MPSRRGNHEGTIAKTKHGTYRAQISINRKRYSKSFKKKTAAQRWLRSKGQEAESGLPDYSDLLLGKYLKQWFRLYRSSIRNKTAQDYERYLSKYMIPQIGHIKLGNLSPLRIDQYYEYLYKKEGKSPSTIKHLHCVLHRALEYAVDKQILPKNPSHRAIIPKVEKKEMEIFTPEEIRKFLHATKFSPYEMVYYLAIKTGARQSELFALKWTDLDWDHQTLHIQRQLIREKKGIWYFGPLKTEPANRTIPLSKQTMEKLKIHRDHVDIMPEIATRPWQENNLLLPSQTGTPHSQGNIRNKMKEIIENEKLQDIRFHDLRHTTASIMINAGIPIVEVSRLLGHNSIGFTMGTYTHFIPSMHTEKTEQIDNILNLVE